MMSLGSEQTSDEKLVEPVLWLLLSQFIFVAKELLLLSVNDVFARENVRI